MTEQPHITPPVHPPPENAYRTGRLADTIMADERNATYHRRRAEHLHAQRASAPVQVAPVDTGARKPAGDPDVADPSVWTHGHYPDADVQRPPEQPPTTIPG